MVVGFDIDGTVDSDPASFGSLMAALRAAGHQVVVLTGVSAPTVSEHDLAAKAEYLTSLGLGHCWDTLVAFGDPPHKAKAKWCRKHNVAIMVDNSIKNAKLASRYCTVLVPWGSREK